MSGGGLDFVGKLECGSVSDTWENALDFGGERQSTRGQVAMASNDVEARAARYGGLGHESSSRGQGRLSGTAETMHIEGEDDGPTHQGEGACRGRGRGRERSIL
jgi:hypothetical protein